MHEATELRRQHPVFFWGIVSVIVVLAILTLVVGLRIPVYHAEAAELDQLMSATERETRDRVLNSQTRRSELALSLFRRELQLKALEDEGVHLALDTNEEVLLLRHGAATLRRVPMEIGRDSTIRGPEGRVWRFVRPVGERHVDEKQIAPSLPVPEWVYAAGGKSPPEDAPAEALLGEFVIRLDDGTEIYTRPAEGPFAEGVKPASFVVPEEEMQAIFEAVEAHTPVYIY